MSDIYLLNLSDKQNYPYQVIDSKRAKYVRIKLSSEGDLSVVLPRGMSAKFAHDFIQKKSFWVEKNLQKIPANNTKLAPEKIDLKLLGECWTIEYEISTNENLHLLELPALRLRITGKAESLDNFELLYKTIYQWCKKKANAIFTQMLEQLAEIHGFHYQRLSIRAQKTRWGSCSNQKNINLNCKLLLMPEDVVKYVMIHELCHTLEMNHSQRFWSLVEACDPDYKNSRKRLKHLAKEIVL